MGRNCAVTHNGPSNPNRAGQKCSAGVLAAVSLRYGGVGPNSCPRGPSLSVTEAGSGGKFPEGMHRD